MTSVRLATITLLAMTAACSGSKDSTAPAPMSANGIWGGTFLPSATPSTALTLTLAESNGAVTGAGSFTIGTTPIPLTATGAYASPHLALILTNPFFQSIDLEVTVSATAMIGTLNGSGYTNQPISLVRQ